MLLNFFLYVRFLTGFHSHWFFAALDTFILRSENSNVAAKINVSFNIDRLSVNPANFL